MLTSLPLTNTPTLQLTLLYKRYFCPRNRALMVSSATLSCDALILRPWSVIRRPYWPQITVVPLVEPPVATLTRPFIIFLLRSSLGSSQLLMLAVAEKCLTSFGEESFADLATRIVGRAAVEVDMLRARKAPARQEGMLVRIMSGSLLAELNPTGCVLASVSLCLRRLRGLCRAGGSRIWRHIEQLYYQSRRRIETSGSRPGQAPA